MKRAILIGIGVLLAAAIGVGVWIYSTLDDQTEASADTVIEEFRASVGPAQPDRPGLPQQGVYEYRVSGQERIVSTVTVNRTLPATAAMLVRHRPDGYETETLYSREHTELSRYALRPQGAYVTFAVTKLIVGPITTTRERSWTPELLRLPLTDEPGEPASWGGRFRAGDLRLTITNRRLPNERIDVGGTPVPVQVFESVQDISGDFTGGRTETFWYSPEYSLVVRYSIDSSVEGDTDLDFRADQTLLSLTPRV